MLKRPSAIICLTVFFITGALAAEPGTGKVKLTEGMIDYFIKYIKGKGGNYPNEFIMASDSSWATYYYCPDPAGCSEGATTSDIMRCERKAKSSTATCAQFARFNKVTWKNGINKGGKAARFKKSMTRNEVVAKLTELGFYGDGTEQKSKKIGTKKEPKATYITKKEKKKATENTKTSDIDVIQTLKELNELYKSGVLTKEEFEKAKKKLLN